MSDTDQAARLTQESLIADHAMRATRRPTVVLPGGRRIAAAPYLGVKHPSHDDTLFLSNPKQFLKKTAPGAVYLWRKRDDPKTGAMVAAQHIRPVEIENIDRSQPVPIQELSTASGAYVVWNNMALFEMPAKYVQQYYRDYEDYAISLVARQAEQFQEDVEVLSGGAAVGKVTREA